ncbi:cation acetate symporter [Streptomyces gobiensis]|uniref:sodium/solute symporter n=1 Tax=Streptomyces gobiensis TaxID=2875706 RepID=UPI001E363D18|nr:cation acetate symporter [Streptomyces gobiensis]UGY91841.1 cation acetate symporter [Streptomyces gobiensis]
MNNFDASAQTLSLAIFCAVVSITLLLCIMTSAEADDLGEFYTGYRSLSPTRNGLAIAGDYISAATVLNTIGIIALTGYDGLILALSTALSLLLLMFLLAEPLRNAGKFTMGDALTRRSPSRSVRITTSAVTLLALVPMMVVQLAGAGYLITLILGFSGEGVRTGCIIVLGLLMIAYATIGGMKGTALIQIIKIVVLTGAATAVAILVMDRFSWSPGELLSQAQQGSGAGPAFLSSGLQFGTDLTGRLDTISGMLTVVIGAAVLPHVTMRMYTAHSAPAIRRAMSWAVGVVIYVVLLIAVIGVGATALIGARDIAAASPQGSNAILHIGQAVVEGSGTLSTLVFTAIATAVFLTLLSSVAGMTLACASSIAHDLAAHGVHRGGLSAAREMTTARLAGLGVGLAAIGLAILVQDWTLQALITLSFCIGASAITPALVYSLFWRRYTRTGLLATLIGGSLCVLVLLTFSSVVSGGPHALITSRDFSWFPLHTTGLISIPAGFLLGWLGTVFSDRRTQQREQQRYEAVEPRILAGTDAPG